MGCNWADLPGTYVQLDNDIGILLPPPVEKRVGPSMIPGAGLAYLSIRPVSHCTRKLRLGNIGVIALETGGSHMNMLLEEHLLQAVPEIMAPTF